MFTTSLEYLLAPAASGGCKQVYPAAQQPRRRGLGGCLNSTPSRPGRPGWQVNFLPLAIGGNRGWQIHNDLHLRFGGVDHEQDDNQREGNQNGAPKFSRVLQYISNEWAVKMIKFEATPLCVQTLAFFQLPLYICQKRNPFNVC